MQELEKILEEIEQRVNYYKEHATLEYVDICAGLREAEGIIRKHMNDGWMPVEKKLPPNAKYKGALCPMYQLDTKYGVTEGWYNPDLESWFVLVWFMTERYVESDIDFERGSYPKIVRCENKVNDKNSIVTAWRPLPEPYRLERSINMTESEVLKIFENEVIILDCWIEQCKDIIADCETEEDEFDDDKERAELSLKDYTERKEAFDVAISALKEIQLYKDNKLCLVPEDVYSRQCSELDTYKEIGTVEECREAVERQNTKKLKEILRHRGGFEMHHCSNCDTHYQTDNRYTIKDNYCPVCRKLLDSAFRKYCGNCGQAIAENLEGMEDE